MTAPAPLRVRLLGYPVSSGGAEECADAAFSWVTGGERGRTALCLNPHTLETAEEDPLFKEALFAADLLLADGVGIVLASRLLGAGVRRRVTGSDLFLALSRRFQREGFPARYFLLGATPEALAGMRTRMGRDFPGLVCAGVHSPPFAYPLPREAEEEILAAIRRARPHVVWVGMTAPRQEKWIHRFRDRLDAPFIAGIGAVFDFYAGTRARSPVWAQRAGLEWLVRWLREPRRLWRRNLVSAPRFVGRVLAARFAPRSPR